MRTKEKENGSEMRTRSYALAGTFAIAIALIAAIMVMPAMAQDEIVWEYTGLYHPMDAERLANGNTLITDSDNHRVIEVTPDGTIVWEYTGLNMPNDAERLASGNTLFADYNNHRVIEVTPDGTIVWVFVVRYPSDVERLANGNTLITTHYESYRVIEVTPDGTIVWEYSTGLSYPYDAERLSNGNTLIADFNNCRVIEVSSDGSIVWEYISGLPDDAERLSNGNTLITDFGNDRVIEVTPDGTIVWEYSTGIGWPFDANRLSNGNTLITDYKHNRVIEVGTPAEPDLVVEKSVEFNDDGKFVVSYTVTNIGDGPAGESTTCKYVNDQEMEREPCPVLGSGESYSGSFESEPCPCGETLNVTVCADNDDDVEESDETNNCVVNIVECPPCPPEIPVDIDVKPGSCPNPLNLKSKGVLPVAVLGTAEFDVTTIDPGTILLTREGCEGVAAIRWSYEDVATPFTGELCDCNDLNGDGYIDLTLKFDTQELVSNLELDKVAGETIPLTVTGNLNAENGGTPIEGKDCIRVQ